VFPSKIVNNFFNVQFNVVVNMKKYQTFERSSPIVLLKQSFICRRLELALSTPLDFTGVKSSNFKIVVMLGNIKSNVFAWHRVDGIVDGKVGFASLAHVCLHNIISCLKVFGDDRLCSDDKYYQLCQHASSQY